MPSHKPTLASRVLKWLKDTGYPLEMRTALAFQRAGFKVVQSDYYTDPDTNKPREIDLVTFRTDVKEEYAIRLTFVVECKVSRDKPWVLFTSRESVLPSSAKALLHPTSKLGKLVLLDLANSDEGTKLFLFKPDIRNGHGLKCAFLDSSKGVDVAYTAATQVIKASLSKIENADKPVYGGKFCEIFFPTILIDAELFEFYLDEQGSPAVSPVSEGTLCWRHPFAETDMCVIPSLRWITSNASWNR